MKYSIHDGPGIRTAVFLKGCPLNCWWCHNPESQSPIQEIMHRPEYCISCGDCAKYSPTANVCCAGARELIGKKMTVNEVMLEIEKDIIFYDESGGGVTFSGGEPLSQPEFLKAMLAVCKAKEIHTVVETTGFAKYAILQEIAALSDMFLYDVKIMDDKKHKNYTGVSNKLILENIIKLTSVHDNIIVRIPIIPGVNDDEENIDATGKFLLGLPKIEKVHLLPYHNAGAIKYPRLGKDYKLVDVNVPDNEVMEIIASKFQKFNLKTQIGG